MSNFDKILFLMKTQNYKNHTRLILFYHYIILPIIVLAAIGSVINLVKCIQNNSGTYSAALIFLLCVIGIITFFTSRMFALKAQDRAIRAEENLRHFVLTGRLLDRNLRLGQIIALRFAPDEEFVELAKKAIDNKLSGKQIKMEIKR